MNPRKIVEDGEKALRECREVEDLMRRGKESLEHEHDRRFGTRGVNKKLEKIILDSEPERKFNRRMQWCILGLSAAGLIVAVVAFIEGCSKN